MLNLKPEEQLRELKKGVLEIVSEKELLEKLEKSYEKKKPLKIKAGFDPSNPDLHLGHAVLLQKMKVWQDLGHEVIFLIGDFTALIGDPTGRNKTRPLLTKDKLKENSKTYKDQVFKILDPKKTITRYNSEWFSKMDLKELIELASKYTVARMLERDDFKKRFEQETPISVHEFLYPLVQGYDSVILRADVELGGSDQTFNLLVGRTIQKHYGQTQQSIMTLPLLEGLDGVQKMSKSYDNYIGLDESPQQMFGKTMKLSDELMIRYYELLTDKTVKQTEEFKKDLKSSKLHPRDVKLDLAHFFVTRFHGKKEAEKAKEEFRSIFQKGGLPESIDEKNIEPKDLGVCQLLFSLNLASSNSEARRLIQGGAVMVLEGKLKLKKGDFIKAQEKILNDKESLSLESGHHFILKVGKRKFMRVRVS